MTAMCGQPSTSHPLLADATGYYGLLHFIVTAAVLAWLFWRQPGAFPRLRSALVLATTAANIVFWIWPAAPPRLARPGMTDTLVTGHILGAADHHVVSRLADLYAAMPSLHVAWATWCAFAASCYQRIGATWWQSQLAGPGRVSSGREPRAASSWKAQAREPLRCPQWLG